MEYVFGTRDGIEVLKTEGSAHTDLTGFQQVERPYPGQIITDYFRVVCKLDSAEDVEGNCYDWYEIDRHYRVVDKTGPVVKRERKNAANIDYLNMMKGVELPDGEEGEDNA